ncbi:basic region leucine zipper [Necator americanus]|uniref:Basic region leucine zipper n=1 Tax=Necator americanus TaxID=51031 RepID=W2TLI6_NECAM|nr:basic region leucine zipper [Necator americanus]ETN82638.1 basic region leucine zipper [Necator americanus]
MLDDVPHPLLSHNLQPQLTLNWVKPEKAFASKDLGFYVMLPSLCASSRDSRNAGVAFVEPAGNAVDPVSTYDQPVFNSSFDQPYCYLTTINLPEFATLYTSTTPSSFIYESPCLAPPPVVSDSHGDSSARPESQYSSDPESPPQLVWKLEKREKKKAQNRTAALRYREKKRLDKEKKTSEIVSLTQRNQELRSKVLEVSGEVAILKKLLVELNIYHE